MAARPIARATSPGTVASCRRRRTEYDEQNVVLGDQVFALLGVDRTVGTSPGSRRGFRRVVTACPPARPSAVAIAQRAAFGDPDVDQARGRHAAEADRHHGHDEPARLVREWQRPMSIVSHRDASRGASRARFHRTDERHMSPPFANARGGRAVPAERDPRGSRAASPRVRDRMARVSVAAGVEVGSPDPDGGNRRGGRRRRSQRCRCERRSSSSWCGVEGRRGRCDRDGRRGRRIRRLDGARGDADRHRDRTADPASIRTLMSANRYGDAGGVVDPSAGRRARLERAHRVAGAESQREVDDVGGATPSAAASRASAAIAARIRARIWCSRSAARPSRRSPGSRPRRSASPSAYR